MLISFRLISLVALWREFPMHNWSQIRRLIYVIPNNFSARLWRKTACASRFMAAARFTNLEAAIAAQQIKPATIVTSVSVIECARQKSQRGLRHIHLRQQTRCIEAPLRIVIGTTRPLAFRAASVIAFHSASPCLISSDVSVELPQRIRSGPSCDLIRRTPSTRFGPIASNGPHSRRSGLWVKTYLIAELRRSAIGLFGAFGHRSDHAS